MAAETNQEKQKRAELNKVSPHFSVIRPLQISRAEEDTHLTILVVSREENLKACFCAAHAAPWCKAPP